MEREEREKKARARLDSSAGVDGRPTTPLMEQMKCGQPVGFLMVWLQRRPGKSAFLKTRANGIIWLMQNDLLASSLHTFRCTCSHSELRYNLLTTATAP